MDRCERRRYALCLRGVVAGNDPHLRRCRHEGAAPSQATSRYSAHAQLVTLTTSMKTQSRISMRRPVS